MASIIINGTKWSLEKAPDDIPLLWFIRDFANLKGTKYGCGIAQCGACTVHIDGQPVRSCVTPAISVDGAEITTIEGLSSPAGKALQDAWMDEEVSQCGYCQSGQIMQASSLLTTNVAASEAEITEGMSGNLCRCGTYPRIKKAILSAQKSVAKAGN